MLIERELKGSGGSLNLAVGPESGPPLLFLHGVGRRWQDFIPFATDLADRRQILALDLRGHGRSARVDGRYRVIDYVDDVVRVLEGLGGPAVIYGHSLGALVAAAAAAAARPEAVRGLVLEDPVGTSFLDRLAGTSYLALFTAMQRLAGRARSAQEITKELAETRLPTFDARGSVRLADLRDSESIRFSAQCLVDVDPGVYDPILSRSWLDGLESETIWSGARRPVLLLRADESQGGMLTQPDADALAGWIADLTTVEFPGVGHLIHRAAPDKTLTHVYNFLESLNDR